MNPLSIKSLSFSLNFAVQNLYSRLAISKLLRGNLLKSVSFKLDSLVERLNLCDSLPERTIKSLISSCFRSSHFEVFRLKKAFVRKLGSVTRLLHRLVYPGCKNEQHVMSTDVSSPNPLDCLISRLCIFKKSSINRLITFLPFSFSQNVGHRRIRRRTLSRPEIALRTRQHFISSKIEPISLAASSNARKTGRLSLCRARVANRLTTIERRKSKRRNNYSYKDKTH